MTELVAISDIEKSKGNADDHEYSVFRLRMQTRFVEMAKKGPLFTTNLTEPFEAWLSAFAPSERQFHNCHACKNFLDRYGSLVTIDERGHTTPAFWNEEDAPELYKPSVHVLINRVYNASVSGVFYSSDAQLGTEETGLWRHMAVTLPKECLHSKVLLTPGQYRAEKLEDFKNMQRALKEFTLPIVAQAVTLLKSDQLYRQEKVLGMGEWLLRLHESLEGARGRTWSNLLWRAVALAPTGFCHPRASMIGTLLEDLASGMDFQLVSERFANKMHPLQYQRPQAAPTAGNVKRAEEIFQKLGLERALERRFAFFEEVPKIWEPKPPVAPPKGEGIFGHLETKGSAKKAVPELKGVPPTVITFEKFRRVVLPEADHIALLAPPLDNYCAFVTAVHDDAPKLLQWDNHVSWYVYSGGSLATRWNLVANEWVDVTGIVLQPNMWTDEEKYAHQGKGVLFVLKGARDTRGGASLALFPEILRSELREVRATIEAHSRSRTLANAEQASACGIVFKGTKGTMGGTLRVTSKGQKTDYQIDRWD